MIIPFWMLSELRSGSLQAVCLCWRLGRAPTQPSVPAGGSATCSRQTLWRVHPATTCSTTCNCYTASGLPHLVLPCLVLHTGHLPSHPRVFSHIHFQRNLHVYIHPPSRTDDSYHPSLPKPFDSFISLFWFQSLHHHHCPLDLLTKDFRFHERPPELCCRCRFS